MARPKKEQLSPAVGPLNLGRKRANPDFVSSSFYCPKRVNLRFDRALLSLKAAGFALDRSDILSALMDRFTEQVEAAEQAGGEMDLQALLGAASERAAQDSGDVSALKAQMRLSVEAMREREGQQTLAVGALFDRLNALDEKLKAQQNG